MSEEKFKDLVLNYTPAMRGLKGNVSLKVDYAGVTYNLDGEHSVRIPLTASGKPQILNLQLHEGDRVYGTGTANVDTLIDKQTNVTLGQGVAVLEGKLEERLAPKRRKNSVDLKCPYLEKLSNGQQADSDVLEQIMLQRTGKSEGGLTSVVKISLEPDSPTKTTLTELPELESLNYGHLENMNPSQLKKLIVVLSENIQQNLSKAQRLNGWRQELYNKTQDRLEMQQDMNRKTENLRSNALSNVQKLQNNQESRNDKITKLRELQSKQTQLTQDLDELKAREVCLKRENLELKARQLRHEDLQTIVDESIHLTQEFENSSNQVLQQAEQNNTKAERDVSLLQHEIAELKAKLELTQESEKQIIGDNNALREKIRDVKMELAEKADIVNRIQEAEKAGELHAQGRRQAQDELGNLIAEIQSNLDPLKSSVQELISKKKDLSEQVISLQSTVAEKDNRLQELRVKLQEASINIATMEQLCCIKEDLHQLCEEMERVKELHQNTKVNVMQSLQDASDYLFKQAENTLNESKTIDKLIENIEEKESEIEALKQVMDSVRKRVPVYVPIKDDPIDTALAQYLNSKTDPLAIPFAREDLGFYMFGTKKVQLKFEFGRITIRIGGGFMHIDEFLEIYTPIELERQESKLMEGGQGLMSLSRFTASGSPAKGMSPVRASRIIAGVIDSFNPSSPRRSLATKK